MSGQGKEATHDDLTNAGYASGGIEKGSVGAGMMSYSDKQDSGKDVVSSLQSAGAKGQGISGPNMSRSGLTDAGLTHAGVTKGSSGANMMRGVDKSGSGGGVKASLQSMGAKK